MVSKALPKWQCHKVVEGSAIRQITPAGDQALLALACGSVVPVSTDWLRKHEPQVGGVYVRYPDGYESYSPMAAWLDGYTKLEPRWLNKRTHEPMEDVRTVTMVEWNDKYDQWSLRTDGVGGPDILIFPHEIIGREPRKKDRWITQFHEGLIQHTFLKESEFQEQYVLEFNPHSC